ncbi:MAG TPA: nuclear transport factor 2 family protein [Actinomycetota bacterium]|jgi:ketosteroid isomerase-like protein
MTHDDHATQVLELGRRWAEAERRGDADALDALLHEDFVGVGPLGFVLDKRQWLEPRRNGDLKNSTFEWQDPSVRVFGDAAVVIGTQVQESTYQGRDASGRFRVTQVAARSGDRWSLAGMHLSPIAQAPPR